MDLFFIGNPLIPPFSFAFLLIKSFDLWIEVFDIITPSIEELKIISAISPSSFLDRSGSIFIKTGTFIEFFLLKDEIFLTNLSKLSFFSNSLRPGVFGEDTFNVI